MRRALGAAAAALALVAGCSGYKIVRDGAVNRDLIERLELRAENLRDLRFREPVGVRVYSKEALVAFVEEILEREYGPEDLEGIERALVRFGLVREDVDYFALLKETLRDNAAGFYDPEAKEFRLIEDFRAEFAGATIVSGLSFIAQRDYVGELVVVHELVHALQDQHFDLQKTLPVDLPNTDEDAYAARKAIVESEANLVAYGDLYRIDLRETGRRGVLVEALVDNAATVREAVRAKSPDLPQFLVKELVFQYFGALPLIHRAMARGGWRGVDALYADPPESTEQLLHPDRYFAVHRDRPVRIDPLAAVGALPAGARVLDANVMGELGIGVLLEEFVDAATAEDAAAGWGGDRFDAVEISAEDGARTVLLWRTVWDTAPDAGAFALAYAQALEAKYPGRLDPLADPAAGPRVWRIRPGGGAGGPASGSRGVVTRAQEAVAIEVRGTRVFVVEGVPPERLGEILEGLWEAPERVPSTPPDEGARDAGPTARIDKAPAGAFIQVEAWKGR